MQFGSILRDVASIAELLQAGINNALNRSLNPDNVTVVTYEPSLLHGIEGLLVSLVFGPEQQGEFTVAHDRTSSNEFIESRWYTLHNSGVGVPVSGVGVPIIKLRIVLFTEFTSNWGQEVTIPPSYSMFRCKIYEMIYNDDEYDDDDSVNTVWNISTATPSTVDITLLLVIINALLDNQMLSLQLYDANIIALHTTSNLIQIPLPQLLADALDQFNTNLCAFSSELSRNFILRMVEYINKKIISSRGVSNNSHLFMKNVCSDKKRSQYLATFASLTSGLSGVKPLPADSTGLTVLEFFSGIGGMRLSLPSHIHGLPITKITAYDCNDIANQIYHHNFHTTCIDNITNSKLKRMLIDNLSVADVDGIADIWTMSPPCQPYTTTRNSKQLDEKDNRSHGIFHLMHLLVTMKLRPRWIFLENVQGTMTSLFTYSLTHSLTHSLTYSLTKGFVSPTR